jgi:hypothetical protein
MRRPRGNGGDAVNKLFKYSIGTSPYPELSVTLWGEDRGKFPDLESALHGLFLGHPFPVALTGRWQDRFFPGISLAGVPAEEVVQVWTTDPEVVKRFEKALKAQTKTDKPESHHEGFVPHDGTGERMGIACEIHVGMIHRFQMPKIAGLLTDGTIPKGATSPAGARMLSFTPNARSALQLKIFQAQLAGISGRHDLDGLREQMKGQLANMNEGIRMLNAYCNGTESLQHLHRGDRAPGADPYCLFQSRVYLDEELGLIANLVEMDFSDVPQADKWLFASDRWKKLLPLPKCILVTRIRRDEKDYGPGAGMVAAYWNALNMAHLVWIRDGENVWRFGTDVKFEERIFPAADDASELVSRIQEMIWRTHYAPKKEREDPFPEQKLKPAAPWESKNPVSVKWEDDVKFPTLESWLSSDRYTPELNLSIHRRASDALRAHARASMPFALLLQGIIDLKGILNIPAGSDLFDSQTQARFIRLISDFSGGIADSRLTKQFERHVNGCALKPGDRIVGWRWGVYTDSDRWAGEVKWNKGKKAHGLFVFTVHHVNESDPKKDWSGKNFEIFAHHPEPKKRAYVNRYGSGEPFNQKMAPNGAPICGEFLPLDLPESLAEKLLDDRNWKRANAWAVPLLAQWHDLRKQFAAVPDEKPFSLKMRKKAEEIE